MKPKTRDPLISNQIEDSLDQTIVGSRYTFVADPDDLRIAIESRGDDTWAVCDPFGCLNVFGDFEYEPMPSNRSNEFIARTRFEFSDAVRRARAYRLKVHKEKQNAQNG